MVMNTWKLARKIAGRTGPSERREGSPTRRALASVIALTLGVALSGWQSTALADARTQAKRLHDRIASVPPTDADLNTMATMITNGNSL